MALVSSLVFKMLYLKIFNYNNKWLNVENSIHTGDNGYIFLNYSKKTYISYVQIIYLHLKHLIKIVWYILKEYDFTRCPIRN